MMIFGETFFGISMLSTNSHVWLVNIFYLIFYLDFRVNFRKLRYFRPFHVFIIVLYQNTA